MRKKIYDIPRILRIEKILSDNVEALFIFIFLGVTILFFLTPLQSQRLFYLNVFDLFSMIQLAWHTLLLLKIKRMRIQGKNYRRVVFKGVNRNMDYMIQKIEKTPDIGYQIAGLFAKTPLSPITEKIYKGKLD